jgi:hypothetical protein
MAWLGRLQPAHLELLYFKMITGERFLWEWWGMWTVDVAAGQIGGQALKLGLIDQVVVNQVPVVFGSGRPFFATGALAEPLQLENPTTIVAGDRVTHLVYDARP